MGESANEANAKKRSAAEEGRHCVFDGPGGADEDPPEKAGWTQEKG